MEDPMIIDNLKKPPLIPPLLISKEELRDIFDLKENRGATRLLIKSCPVWEEYACDCPVSRAAAFGSDFVCPGGLTKCPVRVVAFGPDYAKKGG